MSTEDLISFDMTENHMVSFQDTSNPKRKSIDIAPDLLENGENAPPNENIKRKSNDSDSSTSKRSRTQKAESKESFPLSSSIPKKPTRGSGLPKPLPKRSSQIRGTVKGVDSTQPHASVSFASSMASTISATTNPVLASNLGTTATPFPGTPYKSALLSSSISSTTKGDITEMPTTGILTRSLRKHQADYLTQKDKIQYFFQSGISIKDVNVNAVVAPLAKSKAKFFDRSNASSKKFETAAFALKDMVTTLLGDISCVRDNCVSHENVLNDIIVDVREKLKDSTTTITALQASEARHKKEVLRLTYENDAMKASQQKLDVECDQLRHEVKDLSTRLIKAEEQLKSEERLRTKAESVAASLEHEMSHSRSIASQSITEVKEEYNQRIEQSISGYKQEIALLRNEIERKQGDLERYSSERSDGDKRSMELQQEIYRIQSLQREAENARDRLEREVERLSSDLNSLREQSLQKDTDLRTTLMSLTDLQRQSAEEKAGLRAEISTMLIRVKALEDERLSIMSELSLKRDDYSSTARELQQYKDNIAILEEKLRHKESESMQSKEITLQLEIEKELRSRCEVREEAERRERIAACAQLIAIQNETNTRIREIEERMNHQLESATSHLQHMIAERDGAIAQANQHSEKIVGLDSEIVQLKHALERASTQGASHNNVMDNESVQELVKISGEVEILRRRVRETAELKAIEMQNAATRIAELEEQVIQGEKQRRKLHNVIQELRGNIRVFARVRPFLPSDGIDMTSLPDSAIMPLADGMTLRAIKKPGMNDMTNDDKHEEHQFSYDKVFGPSCSQETIFHEVSEFVQSALDGYNVCLFSYGQTGSGKTHTMQGSGNGSMRGIIPRAMEQIGKYKTELEGRGWKYEMEVCFIEIYNETIRDLLRNSPNDDVKHDIKRESNGHTYISDVTMMGFDPNDTDKIDGIMELAARHRSVSQTLMNERSSRSHSVFMVYLTASNEAQNVHLKGTLSLVDLAGSERLDRSGAAGARMKETVAINKSLSSLVDVFTAIGNKQSHIPFRNSKLTYLLQSALSGDGKTLMLVNVSPTEESYFESLCSLRLARQVNQCELGKPKRQCATGTNNPASTSSSSSSSSSTLSASTASSSMKASGGATPSSRGKAVAPGSSTGPSYRK